jgi:hypothetical protein
MAVKSHLSMQFPKEMVAMMGGSANCNVDSNGILERLEN